MQRIIADSSIRTSSGNAFFTRWLPGLLTALAVLAIATSVYAQGNPYRSEGQEKKDAANIVGPDKYDNNCQTCHKEEYEAWLHSHHFSTIKVRHQSPRAKEVLAAMEQRSMKRAGDCRQCHYTSIIKADKMRATWGVSCESCHGVGKAWNETHNKVGGTASGKTIEWGTGKNGSAAERAARLAPAKKAGMITSDMTYEIATNCFQCHTVPNETLVNKGGHKPGSDGFDLAVWSQGEVRHNYASSAGAPDSPSNRPATASQLRKLYVIGQIVDLEYSLRNITVAKEKGGTFHKAMVERANKARGKLAAVLSAVSIPEIAGAVNAVPKSITASTKVTAAMSSGLSKAGKNFSKKRDGSKLSAIDGQIGKGGKGKAWGG